MHQSMHKLNAPAAATATPHALMSRYALPLVPEITPHMAKKKLYKGNIALAEGAIRAGCRFYFGYPITPQNEIPEYMSWRIPKAGGGFIQAESEVAAINMVLGAAAAGGLAMTTTSSPGYSLMQEGMSFLAACHLPCLIANIQRGGPGLGNIAPSQADYFQAVKGGGHGDYRVIVLAPESPQEMMDFAIKGFDLAQKYRIPALILADGAVGLMMETIEDRIDYIPPEYKKNWALTGAVNRKANCINSLWLDETGVEKNNIALQNKYAEIKKNEQACETYLTEDAKLVFAAYGFSARIARSVVDQMRSFGMQAGLIRPLTLFPFPEDVFAMLNGQYTKCVYVIEMSAGQFIEDVRLSLQHRIPVHFHGSPGGIIPDEEQIYRNAVKLYESLRG